MAEDLTDVERANALLLASLVAASSALPVRDPESGSRAVVWRERDDRWRVMQAWPAENRGWWGPTTLLGAVRIMTTEMSVTGVLEVIEE